jgi:hypothetical protein
MAGLNHASIKPARASSEMSAEALFSAGKVASFRMQVSRTTRKVAPGASQRLRASLRFDERNRVGLGHRFAPVLAVRTGQCRRQLEPNNLAANDGRCIHDISVRAGSQRHKRSDTRIPAGLRPIRPDETTQTHVGSGCATGSRFDTQPPSPLSLNRTRGTET